LHFLTEIHALDGRGVRPENAAFDGVKEFFRDLDLFPGEDTFFGTPALEVYGDR